MKNERVLESYTHQMELPTHLRTSPGVLVFTVFLQLQYLNQEARRLFSLTTHTYGVHATGVFPPELTAFLKEIRERLHRQITPKDWEDFELTKTLHHAPVPILLRGIGLPNPRDIRFSHIILLVEEIRRRSLFVPAHVKESFQFTCREQGVLEHLCKGLTNKEIAPQRWELPKRR